MRQLALIGVLAVAATVSVDAGESRVEYPEEYRDWTHVKSMVIEEGHPLYQAFGGIHHIYANPTAVDGYRNGSFADGSVIVFDLLEAVTGDNSVTEGGRKVLGVMQKDSRQFDATGGWGFEGFAAGDPQRRVVGSEAAAACFQCHTAREKHGFVFSVWRE